LSALPNAETPEKQVQYGSDRRDGERLEGAIKSASQGTEIEGRWCDFAGTIFNQSAILPATSQHRPAISHEKAYD
jgi:hypothetical protein